MAAVETMSNLDLIFLILTTFTFVCGLIGNLFIASIIMLQKHMQTITNWFVFNLCICDLFIVLIVIPYNAIIPKIDWPFGTFGCRYLSPILEHFAGVCVLTHTCLSVARFLVLKSAMHGQTLTMKHVRITLALVWLIPFFTMSVALMPGLMGNPTVTETNGQLFCYFNINKGDSGDAYKMTAFLLTYVIPMLSTGFAYFKINRIVSENMKTLNGHMSENALQERRNKSKRMNRALMTMYLMFGLTTLPIQTYYLITMAGYTPESDVWIVFQFLLTFFYGQVVTNPFVLFYMSAEYRKAVYRLPLFVCRPSHQAMRHSVRNSIRRFQRRKKSRDNTLSSVGSRRNHHKDNENSADPSITHQPQQLSNGYIPIESFMINYNNNNDTMNILPNENGDISPKGVVDDIAPNDNENNDNLRNNIINEGNSLPNDKIILQNSDHMINHHDNQRQSLTTIITDDNISLDLDEELEKARLLHHLVSSNSPPQPSIHFDINSLNLMSFFEASFEDDDGRETNI